MVLGHCVYKWLKNRNAAYPFYCTEFNSNGHMEEQDITIYCLAN